MRFSPRLVLLVLGLAALCAGRTSAAVEADLLAGYDASYASSVGGVDNVEVLVANAVASSNYYNDRSGTGARMHVVGYYQSARYNYQATSNGGFVGWLANYDSRLSDVVDQGNALAADLVMYVCDSTNDGAAAVAQQPGRYSSLDATYFYSIVLAHETAGHNYGRSHSDGLLSSPKTIMLHNYCGGGAQGWYTNPNIYVNGKRLLGDGATACPSAGTPAVNGGDNSNPTADNALGVAQRYERVVYGPNLGNVLYDWRFNNAAGAAPAGTTVLSGTSPATVQGAGAAFTGSALRVPGGASGSGAAYLKLPGGIVSSQSAVTIEVWATPLAAQNYARVFDFNNGSGSYLTLSACVGTDLNTQRFESKIGGATVTRDAGLYTTAGVQHHYAVTYKPNANGTSGTWTWYRDGDLVTFLAVAYPLSSLTDVNNWLGASAYSADAYANNDYAEVRISNVAMSAGEVQANYELGPNFVPAATVTMNATDASGASSFNAAGHWSNGAAPSSGNTYETYDYVLRTPANAASYTFGGGSLTLSGGKFDYKGTGSSAITVNGLTLKGATVYHDGSGTMTLNGGLAVAADGAAVVAAAGPITLNSNLTGAGNLTFYGVNGTSLKGTNTAYTGKLQIGNGYQGSVAIDSEARLGAAPSSLVADQLQFNRGTLTTTATMTLGATANRGFYFDVDGGYFNVATGTTLTLTAPLASVNMGAGVSASSIGKAGAGTLVLGSTSSAFNGTLYVDTGGAGANDGVVRVTNNQVLAGAKAIYINDNNACSSSLQIDGTTGNIVLPGVTAAARTTTVPQIENVAGSNTVSGYYLNAGGSNQLIQADAGSTLTFNGPIYSLVGGDRTITFQGAGNITTTNTISELTADTVSLVKTGAGVLSLNGACGHDGTTTLNGGTLRLNGSFTTTTGATTAAAGTVLAGTGTTSSPTTVGGAHTPGNATNSTGTQTFNGALTYNAAARLNWTLVANGTAIGTSSKVAAQAVSIDSAASLNVILNGTGSAVDFTNAFWTQPRTWTVLTSTSLSGLFALGTVSADAAGRAVANYGSFALQQTASGVVLAFYPVNATPPAAPTNVAAAGSPGTVAVTWTAANGATSYNVLRATTPGGPYQTVATGVTGTSFTDSSAVNGVTYYYVITAVNIYGASNGSAEAAGLPHLPSVIVKADNTTALNQAGSWTNGVLPNALDTASWTELTGANSVTLGSNVSLGGIIVGNTGGAVGIGAGYTLTLGTNGIDMSAATQNLSVASGLALGIGHQTWNVATGRTLTVGGTFARGAGTTLLVDRSANTGAVAASPTLVNGLLPWAAVRSPGTASNDAAGGYTFATVTGGNLAPYTAAAALTANYSFTSDATANYDIGCTGSFTYGSSRVANSVRHTGGTTTLITNSTQTWGCNALMNAGTGSLSLGAGGNTFNFTAGVGTGTEWVLAATNAAITVGGTVTNNGSAASSVTVVGPNTVTLSGTNTFTGGTSLNSGTLQIGSDGALSSGLLTINGGAIRATGAARAVANSVTLNGSFTIGRGISLNGPVALSTDITVTSSNPDAQAGAVTTFGGVIGGAHGLTFAEGVNPTGTIVLGGPDTYTGGTTLNAGTLQLGNAAALGASAGSLTVNGGTLNLNAFNPTVGTLSGTGGTVTNLASGTATLTTSSSADATFAGALQNGASGQVLALTKQGQGTLTLTGTSNYTGATTVGAGTLTMNGALTGGSAVTVAGGAALGGAGASSGPVSVAAGGALTPGNAAGVGTLTVSGTLMLANGSVLAMHLAAPGASARVALGGVLSASGTTTVNVTALPGYGAGTYPLITGAANLNASNFVLGTVPGGYSYALGASNGTLALTVATPLASPPLDLAAGAGGQASVALTWSALNGATGYNVKRATASSGPYMTIAGGLTRTSYTDSGLAGGTTYYYVVTGVNIAGESPVSNEASSTALSPIDYWRVQNFGQDGYNPAVSGDAADPDHDGVPNLTEYALGTDPNSSTATPTTVGIVNGRLTITFTRNTAATDVTVNVLAADAVGGPWTAIARSTGGAAFVALVSGASTSESGTGATRTVQVGDVYLTGDAAHPKRFLRLQVSH